MPTYTRFGTSFEPWEYTDWIDESMSWKDALYIGDWSPLEKLRVRGPDALAFFSRIAVNSFAKFEVGQAKHIVLCNPAGKIVGEGVLMKLAEEDYLFTSGPGVAWADYQELHGPIEDAHEVYGRLIEIGRQFGIRRLGGRTKMVNHVEACFPIRAGSVRAVVQASWCSKTSARSGLSRLRRPTQAACGASPAASWRCRPMS